MSAELHCCTVLQASMPCSRMNARMHNVEKLRHQEGTSTIGGELRVQYVAVQPYKTRCNRPRDPRRSGPKFCIHRLLAKNIVECTSHFP
jgi:hypothetical protein